MSLASAGKFGEAIPPLETYVKMEPGDPSGHYQLAIAYGRTGNTDGAAREMALQQQIAQNRCPRCRAAAFCSCCAGRRFASQAAADSPWFEEIPPATSGIRLDARRGALVRHVRPRNHRPGLCIPGLRQRRLDGHLPGEQRPLRLLLARAAAAQRPLPQQPRRHLHRRNREGRRERQRLRHGYRRGRLRWRRVSGPVCDAVSAQHPLPQQWRWHLHRRDRESRRGCARMEQQRRLVRLRQRRPAGSVRVPIRRLR